ncbi:hypothetical protein KAX22_07180 [bacterium]|nr:hypothetical protein [bacterium]
MSRLSGGFELSLEVDNVKDGHGYRRSFEFFFDNRVIGSMKLSDQISDSDDKREWWFDLCGYSGDYSYIFFG